MWIRGNVPIEEYLVDDEDEPEGAQGDDYIPRNVQLLGLQRRNDVINLYFQRSGRENYGDNAVGWVQVIEGDICIVKAKVTPEHSFRKKAYTVKLECNEKDEDILSVQCEDCAASLGYIRDALLTWLHRRSEEQPKTSTECYWKKFALADVGTGLKFVKAEDLGKCNPLESIDDNDFLQSFVNHSLELGNTDTVLMKYFKDNNFEKLSLHRLLNEYMLESGDVTADSFFTYCGSKMTEDLCRGAARAIVDQAKSALWHELRYLRITASKAYDVAYCKTTDGSLIESILGASKLKDTAAMVRGKRLEGEVLKLVQKQTKQKIRLCGLVLVPKQPFIGAIPDGVSEDFLVEIKCPTSEKTYKRYVTSNLDITAKYLAQVQLQMYCLKKNKYLFVVAKEDFENSKHITI
ncbi:uncharacterized protein LOC115880915, partial [Sitophilus oryzae]|uniref:Uncharacterized protein LOC115880915 n=1 Tax=Sitophilus oryzae TaxID=7048 RepID=A0A6J2XTG0_SITOR